MKLKILNDQHIGVRRVAGTTPTSADALGDAVISNFRDCLITSNPGIDTVILGDLTDSFTITNRLLFKLITIIKEWLETYPDNDLYLVRGNHDYSNNVAVMSSVELLSSILNSNKNFHYIDEPGLIGDYSVIPHLANQEQFDIAVSKATGTYLLSHCNYDNYFAESADHSLNLSKEQAAKFSHVFIGHEHNFREANNVTALGCQFPTSVSDCLGGEGKYYSVIDGKSATPTLTWPPHLFKSLDWREAAETDAQFIKVTGSATAEEAGTVVSEINKFRRKSKSFIVANAVEIEGLSLSDDEQAGTSELSGLNATEMLICKLSKEHAKAVRALI